MKLFDCCEPTAVVDVVVVCVRLPVKLSVLLSIPDYDAPPCEKVFANISEYDRDALICSVKLVVVVVAVMMPVAEAVALHVG